ncbi:acyl-CoA dehydrogenase family protein [Tumebacillus permanentifrigoris]|uniref:Alkylation response protein AidB-like acyl-CoA dehydrogenase n=1 Tax=Tumebacillus permanentifrigoris TaxID=378543 RepID=A0A316D3L9_9BACL|nr:acyl-CoA dehydrogenase family protein [Tumebacillus permanentifrigoris]PWK05379.1 hypothetical protein C7459_1234 [Tumebacillus permanentifrigoris]
MIIELTEKQVEWQEQFRAFVDKSIVPYAAQIDKEEILHPAVVAGMRETGYLGSMLPQAYGGLGLDEVSLGVLNEEVGRGCTSTRNLLTVHGMVGLAILRWGTQEQKDQWLPKLARGEIIGAFGLSEPDVGSDAKNIQTTAVEDGDDYVLSGTKKWITMGMIADVFLIFAQFEGKPTAFLVESTRANFTRTPIRGMMGSRGSMLAQLEMDNVRIPKENLVGKLGTGLSHVALSCLDYGRYTVAWGCIGLAQACLEASVAYAKSRQQFGKPIGEFQLIQKMLTEMVVSIKGARLLCYRSGYLKQIGDPDSILETWTAKYASSVMVTKVAGDAVQIHGGNGCHDGYPIERYYRDAKINEIIEGSTQVHEYLIARNLLQTM